ncbi:hypothetical protein NIES4102_18950 [Chondrocystis sp. NIES-4102]|nr:hypothetical protein NIES4102_18950 [Chondrocystis sp. NIES-4102]
MTRLTTTETYDVVIMGAGFAGLCQARHLLLNIPKIKVALIDPRPEIRDEKDLKIGESTIEIASLFLSKELGLYEYLVENHVPKIGLNFHWAKDTAKTDTLDDYYHIWSNRNVEIPAFQINRAKLETDLLRMNQEMGVKFYHGRVSDVDLTQGDRLKTVVVKTADGHLELQAKHVVDAAGRKFIIGKKKDNILTGPDNLLGLNNGAVWLRVKNVDRTIFDDGYHPNTATSSHYYATNHYFGHGHWMWMIPIDKEAKELSIGIMQHHEQLPSEVINTQSKFLDFLKANHTMVYNLIESGEIVDFHYWSKVAHKSKIMFSPDNWYVIGDAAYIFDAFYSYGTSTITIAVESVTEIIRAHLAQETEVEEKRELYNKFNQIFALTVNYLYRDHGKQLGHASVMSWRIYFEYMWWFGMYVPMYVGKWHLDKTFINVFSGVNRKIDGLFADLCQQFNQLVERNANIGFMDCYRADQLIAGYYTPKHFEPFLANTQLEPLHTNVFGEMKHTCFYAAIWYAMFQWRGFKFKGVLNPKHIYYFLLLIWFAVQSAIGEMVYKSKTKNMPKNSEIAQMRAEFKNYRYKPQLQPWSAETPAESKPDYSLV